MESTRKYRLTALAVTFVVAVLLVLWMVLAKMTITPTDKVWPPEPGTEIEFLMPEDEEFVEVVSEVGDDVLEPYDADNDYMPSNVASTDPTQISHNPANSGNAEGNSSDLVTSTRPSDIAHKKVDNPGNKKPAPDSAAIAAARQQTSRENIDKSMAGVFGAGSTGQGRPANADGVTPTKGPGGGRGLGMTASHDVRPKSDLLGTIVVNVTVLPDGSVKARSASFNLASSKGKAAESEQLRNACIIAAYSCRFERPAGESTNLPGSISFVWK